MVFLSLHFNPLFMNGHCKITKKFFLTESNIFPCGLIPYILFVTLRHLAMAEICLMIIFLQIIIAMNNNVKIIRKVTIIGVWINVLLMALKLFFGYYGDSDALVADGYHSVSDFVTDFIVIVFVAASYKKADQDHPYGHGKFETVATALIGLILCFVGLIIGWEGGLTLWNVYEGQELPRPDIWTLAVAVLSIILKELCYRYTARYGRKIKSPSLMANAWHHRSDAISSVATLTGVSCALFLGATWRIMDPIASIVIAVMIICSAVKISLPAMNELLEKGISADEFKQMSRLISSVAGVKKVHDLRARMNGHSLIVDVNIHVDGSISVNEGHVIASDVEKALRKSYGSEIITYIHIEPDQESV